MSNPATLSFNKAGTGLFTPEEVRQLMRIEFERARRYTYPVACILVQVDRLDQLATVHGHDSKDEILRAVVELVKRETRAGDLLGYLVEDRLLAMFPHTNAAAVGFLCKRLIENSRRLSFGSAAGKIRITLSIGIAHNQHPGAISFETLERVAEEGVAVADAGGGDRSVETELYQLYEKKHAADDALADGDGYRARLESLVDESGDFERAVAQVAEEIVARVLREAKQDAPVAPADLDPEKESAYRSEIDTLQRRIHKLTQSLGLTETELNRLRKLKSIDGGVSSIYRDVQGLADEEMHAELKQELMSKIFEANLDLQQSRKKTG